MLVTRARLPACAVCRPIAGLCAVARGGEAYRLERDKKACSDATAQCVP